jgi:putative Mg2+ transporter-C (MgtC) family protein
MLSQSEIAIRIGLSALFGAIIGLERERKNWSAGMRTHMMVCVGSALIMLVSAFGFSDVLKLDKVVLDPSRIAAQVVSGIGFIGAGTILFLKQGVIRGLTTASGLWTVAAIGLATGSGMYFAAGITTLAAIIILWGLQPLEKRFSKKFKQKSLQVTIKSVPNGSDIVNELLLNEKIESSVFTFDKKKDESIIQMRFQKIDNQELIEIIRKLEADATVKEVNWNN